MVECRRVVLRPYDDVIILDKTPLKRKLTGKTIVKGETLVVENVAFKVEDVYGDEECIFGEDTVIEIGPTLRKSKYSELSEAGRRWIMRKEGKKPTPCGVLDAPGCYEVEEDGYRYLVCPHPTKIDIRDEVGEGRIIYFDDRACKLVDSSLYCDYAVKLPVEECLTYAEIMERIRITERIKERKKRK